MAMDINNNIKSAERALTMIQRNFAGVGHKDVYQKLQLQGKDCAIQYRNISNHHSIQPNVSKASRTQEKRSSKCG
jgi:hypothetical protein